MVKWLRDQAPNAGAQGSIPGQGTRYTMSQLRVGMPQPKDPAWVKRRPCGPQQTLKVSRAATKT